MRMMAGKYPKKKYNKKKTSCRVASCMSAAGAGCLCVAVCCSVLQCVAGCCRVLSCAAVCCSVLQCVAMCCSVLQCAAVCCSVLQYVAVCCSQTCGWWRETILKTQLYTHWKQTGLDMRMMAVNIQKKNTTRTKSTSIPTEYSQFSCELTLKMC